jgi:hypothetical protein
VIGDDEVRRPPETERKLDELLAELRDERVRPGHALAPRVVRTARWQQMARAPLRVAGMISAAVVDGIASLISPGRKRR